MMQTINNVTTGRTLLRETSGDYPLALLAALVLATPAWSLKRRGRVLAVTGGLRNRQISDKQFSATSAEVHAQIIAAVDSPAAHLGIRRIQNIFREHAPRLYHWAADRAIPAENNLAGRDLRPTVIVRKVSFGSQSNAGATTRGILMSVLVTLKKRGFDVTTRLKEVLDEIARNPTQNPFSLLFPRAGP